MAAASLARDAFGDVERVAGLRGIQDEQDALLAVRRSVLKMISHRRKREMVAGRGQGIFAARTGRRSPLDLVPTSSRNAAHRAASRRSSMVITTTLRAML